MSADPVPLFPLHCVLFPGMPLPLRIFEDRYKLMINRCLSEGRPFGVVLIREGPEVGPGAKPVEVGTLARIRAVERLAGGRMNLFTEGTERFRLLDFAAGAEPYLLGFTEPLSDARTDPVVTLPLADEVTHAFAEYFRLLLDYAGQTMPDYELPTDPEELSFVIAAMLQAPTAERQALLEMTDTAQRLAHERDVLSTETGRMQQAHDNLRDRRRRVVTRLDPAAIRQFESRN